MRRVAFVALLALAACKEAPEPVPAPQKHSVTELAEPPRPAELARVSIKALGMYCEESCPLRVRYALADNKAVYELGFDTANESIFVSYDKTLGSARDVTRPMLKAIKEAGYDPWLARESWPEDATVQVVLR
jgi:hypothetical protein